jgi:dihydroorotate dehydrogenase (NAD+) catalytic subunit
MRLEPMSGLILNGVDYGRAWCASGARSFFAEGWPFHRWLGPLAPDFTGSTFVAKTTTLGPRAGNMPLRDDLMPRERCPRCIRINFRRAAVLNAVGLSGPGLDALLADGRWQALDRPFVLSFMAVRETRERRLEEVASFADRMAGIRPGFRAPFVIECNFSCPNVGIDSSGLVAEVRSTLALLWDRLGDVPRIPKLNILVPPGVAVEVGMHHSCSAVCVSNTIPWGSLPDRIDWRGLFGAVSPMGEFGGGGLSGSPLTPLVLEWVREYCRQLSAPLVAGGGVMRPGDAVALLDAGASAVEVGSVAIVRPWRVAKIIKVINEWGNDGR